MKRKILLSCLFIITLSIKSTVFAQTDEYYRPDTVKKERPVRKEIPPVQDRAPIEKKKPAEFKDRPFIDRLRLGGSFGATFGTYTNVNLSPMAGYEITKKLVAGVGVTGMYFKSPFSGVNSIYYGGRTFVMYSILPAVNIIGEVEQLNVEADTFKKYNVRKWIVSPMLGASLSQPLGGRFIKAVHLTALYNFNYDNQVDDYGANISPYGLIFNQPFIVRVTFL